MRQENVEYSQNCTVCQYDLSGNFIQAFESIKIAGEHTHIDPSCISKVCLGKRQTAGGFIWRYENDPLNNKCDKMAYNASKQI